MFCLVGSSGEAQTFTVSGRVTDAVTGEYILGANVLNVAQGKGASTNMYGFFSMTFPSQPTELRCTFIGYAPESKSFDGQTNACLLYTSPSPRD